MSVYTGAILSCDGTNCSDAIRKPSVEEALDSARQWQWTTVGNRHFCRECSAKRAARVKPADLVPGRAVMRALDAARAAGFTVDETVEPERVTCCGEPVVVNSFIGCPYHAKCETCGAAIADVTGPELGNGHVALVDGDKVDLEDPESWVVLQAARVAS